MLAANLSTLFQDAPFLERFDRAASVGFRAVEVQFADETQANEIAYATRQARVSLALLNAAGDVAGGDFGLAIEGGARHRESIEQALFLAVTTNCPRVHVLTGLGDLTQPECLRSATANLQWAADRLGRRGVALMLEALNPRDRPGYALGSIGQAEKLRQRVGRSNVQLQFDAYHVARCGEDPTAAFKAVFDQVGHVQIADPVDRGEPNGPEMRVFLAALDALDYRGLVGAEYLPRGSTNGGLTWAEPYGVTAKRETPNAAAQP